MEDYEKKYKNAIENMRRFRDALNNHEETDLWVLRKEIVTDIEYYFPELKESKDEKIRKEIIEFVDINTLSVDERHDRWIAWLEKRGESYTKKDVDDAYLKGISDAKNELEKQGEQKPAVTDFNAKDWYVSKVDGKIHNMYQSVDKIEQKPTSDTRYEVKAGNSLSVNGKPFDYEHATITQKDFAPKETVKEAESNLTPLERKVKDILFSFHINAADGISFDGTMAIVHNLITLCQQEQKPADEVEPKFHKGEWIVWKNKCYKVNYNGCGYELIDQNGLSTSLEYGTVDTSARLYDVAKDAKDGDVLADNGAKIIFIFKNIEYDSHIESNVIKYFIRYSFDGINLPLENGGHLGVVGEYSNFVPATKEQRDTLEKAMTDAGYQWDDERKELKKVEQKLVDKVEPFDKYEGLTDFERTLADICIGWIGEELGWKQYIKDNADVLLKIAIKKFNSIQDAPFEQKTADKSATTKQEDEIEIPFGAKDSELQEAIYYIPDGFHAEIDDDKVVIKKDEKSAAWSDEDEERIKNIFSVLDVQVCWDGATGKKVNPYQKEINWLKSLKDRIGG